MDMNYESFDIQFSIEVRNIIKNLARFIAIIFYYYMWHNISKWVFILFMSRGKNIGNKIVCFFTYCLLSCFSRTRRLSIDCPAIFILNIEIAKWLQNFVGVFSLIAASFLQKLFHRKNVSLQFLRHSI